MFAKKTPKGVQVDDRRLRCMFCNAETFVVREAQLNTAVASFFDFDWANATAQCYVCAECGYVHWFLR